jgi:hypothetical protein
MNKLTIGMCTYDDFDGVYFTIQSIRLYHPEVLDRLEFIVVDNNPTGRHGNEIKNFVAWVKQPIKLIPFSEYKSCTLKSKVFEYAETPYVMSVDCHVMLAPGSIQKLLDFYDAGKDGGNLLQGPLLYDDMQSVSTHFDLNWRGQMWGTWGTDDRGKDPNAEPFEIPAQGMGCFSCRKEAWLGFNPKFRGFGAEEGYIHMKYLKAGKMTLCLPFLRWLHRFGRPNGVTYPLLLENKVKNYFIGFDELGMDTTPIYEHFLQATQETEETLRRWHDETKI